MTEGGAAAPAPRPEGPPTAGAAPGNDSFPPAGRLRRLVPAATLVATLVLVVFGARWLVHRVRYVSTDDAQVKGELVLIAARHAGTIVELPIEEGQRIARGGLVARFDDRADAAELARVRAARERAAAEHARAEVELGLVRSQVRGRTAAAASGVSQSRAGLEQAQEDSLLQRERARRGIEGAEAAARAAQAREARALAERENASRDAVRIGSLFGAGVVAEEAHDRTELALAAAEQRLLEARQDAAAAQAALEAARAEQRTVEIKRRQESIAGASLERAQTDLTLAREERARVEAQELNLRVLEAALRQAEAAERAAALRLEECVLASPVAGVVARRIADPGETLAAGQPVALLTDPDRVWVEANVKETALRRVAPGAPVEVRVDALPGRSLRGRVAAVNAAANSQYALLPSGNPSGQFIKVTQRVAVRIELEERDPLLRAGMMAVVDIRAR